MKKIFLPIMLLLLFCNIVNAQTSPEAGQSLEKIVAIVGEEIVLQSDVDGQMMYMKQMDKSIDINDPELRKRILDGLVDQLLMVNKAIKDSVVINDDEVNQRLDLHIQTEVRRFGSEKRVEQVYGMSIPRIKSEIKEKIRQNLLVQNLVAQKFSDIKVTQKEVTEFYNSKKDSLPELPPMVEIYHIVKNVEASKDNKKQIYEFALKIRDSILAGGDFASYAQKYSGDPGTAKVGGELGWFEKGKLFPEFEQAAFKLTTGELSLPVETPFGFHIIQTLEKKSDAVKTRHILFKFGETGDEASKAIAFLDSIRKKVNDGVPFDSLAHIYSDDKETKGFGGLLGKVSIEDIPENIRKTVEDLKVGSTTEPLAYKKEATSNAYHIIFKKQFIPAHKPNLTNDYKEIESMAGEYKKRQLYSDWLVELRKELYWEIKEK
jgi:peptidyl-prolyl cis-trans isomerase SurA